MALCEQGQPDYQSCKGQKHQEGTDKAPFFANGAKDVVGGLLGNKPQARLGSLHVAFAKKSAGANGNKRLSRLVAGCAVVVYLTEQ